MGPSIIRTVTAIVVGWLLSQPLVNGLDVNRDLWVTLVTAVVTAVYYVVVRFLETHVSGKFSFLLASTKQPARYLPSDVVVAQKKAS